MAEVDRLSNSGLYPALPIADKRGSSNHPQQPPREQGNEQGEPEKSDSSATGTHRRPPKSIIDEYA